jgi:hypothetical protein
LRQDTSHGQVQAFNPEIWNAIHLNHIRNVYTSNQNKHRPWARLKVQSKESPVLDGAIASSSGVNTRALSGSDSWHSVLQCLENVDGAFASTHVRLITRARSVAVGLVLCPLAAYVAAAPTLVAFLHTCKGEGATIAAVLALWDSQGRVSVGVHVLLQNRAIWVLGVASQSFPGGRGRRERRSLARASSRHRGGGRCWEAVEFFLREDAVGLIIPGLAIKTE